MKAEQDAAIAALKAGWTTGRTYDAGNVPDLPVTPYRVVSVTAGEPRNYRAGSRASSKFHRVTVQHFGKSFGEVAFASDKTEATLLDKRIGPEWTPCRREVATPVIRDPDGGSLLMTVHTYTTTKPV
jgi:hypothetical protein